MSTTSATHRSIGRMHHAFIPIVVLLLVGTPAAAQERSLSWPSIRVDAHLDADGRLDVRERQVIRFNGDWNGGERRFAVRFGQDFSFAGMWRVDSARGIRVGMQKGNLDVVDGFDWSEQRTVRWRSRLHSDPPFRDSIITYDLEYVYGNILRRSDGNGYVLDHDFAFADREGAIEKFTLQLTIDPAWRPTGDFSGRYEESNIQPGRGFVVRVPLARTSASQPASVVQGTSSSLRVSIAAFLLLAVAAVVARLIMRDARRGRFTPLPSQEAITPEWLQREVFAHLPEVVGVAWDDQTSEAEVAATLARLVQEKKLSSRVETKKKLVLESQVLHLALEVPRSELAEHERALVDALFDSGATTTDTESVRARYRRSGFDPANVIRKFLRKRAARLVPTTRKRDSRIPTLILLGTAIAFAFLSARSRVSDMLATFGVMGLTLPVYGIAMLIASDWRRRVRKIWFGGSFLLAFIGALAVSSALVIATDNIYQFSATALAAIALWAAGLVNSICNRAALALAPRGVVKRKQLVAARLFFEAELRKQSPSFDDSVYPYLLAFGLGSHVDKWFKAFGGELATASRASLAGASGIASTSTGNAPSGNATFSGFGGSGAFSGGGGGASFGAAIGGMAASVPSPASSSSGGGGRSGGGGSSGGGGGGGW